MSVMSKLFDYMGFKFCTDVQCKNNLFCSKNVRVQLFQGQDKFPGGCHLRKSRGRGWRGPLGGAEDLGGWLQRSLEGEVCSPHRAPNRQHKPWREQCSSAPGLHGKGVTWDLWQKWQHPLCREFLNQEGQEPVDGNHYPLKKNQTKVLVIPESQYKQRHMTNLLLVYVSIG